MSAPIRHLAIATTLVLSALLATRADAQDTGQLFDATVLHELHLTLHTDDWTRLRDGYLENTYYPADVTWNGVHVRNAGIRSRGNASRNMRKPGLRVDLDRYVSDQRFLGLKSFVLDNLVQDASGLRERLAMRMFERMGLPAPREAHARLHVNGTYVGTYTIVESIDKDFITRAYAGREEATGRRERDGLLLDYRWNFPYYFTDLGAGLEPYVPLFEPQTHESASPDWLYAPIRDLCRMIGETSDENFTSVVGALLDLEEWIRYVAVETFVAEHDGMLGFAGMNNFYLYRFEGSTLSQVIPWDKDQSFRSASFGIWPAYEPNALMERAMRVPELRNLYLRTLTEAADLAASRDEGDNRGWLERELDQAFRQVRDAMASDASKPQSNDEFLADVEHLRRFARTRSAFVRCEVGNARSAGDPQPCTVEESRVNRR